MLISLYETAVFTVGAGVHPALHVVCVELLHSEGNMFSLFFSSACLFTALTFRNVAIQTFLVALIPGKQRSSQSYEPLEGEFLSCRLDVVQKTWRTGNTTD